jgi:inner membrane protein involved in colicin E2 resistance
MRDDFKRAINSIRRIRVTSCQIGIQLITRTSSSYAQLTATEIHRRLDKSTGSSSQISQQLSLTSTAEVGIFPQGQKTSFVIGAGASI